MSNKSISFIYYKSYRQIYDKSYPYFINNFLNNQIKILHIGTIELFFQSNFQILIRKCRANGIFVIASYHSFFYFEESIEALKYCDLILCFSKLHKQQLINAGLSNVVINYLPSCFVNNNIDSKETLKLKYGIPLNKITISMVGYIVKGKGYDFFLESVQKLSKSYKDQIFINIAGQIKDYTSEYIEDLLIQSGVEYRFTAYQQKMEGKLYSENITLSDVLMIPYTRDSINTSGPLMDAASYNIPIIGTDNGDIGYTIKRWNIGVTFKHNDVNDLCLKIAEYIDNKDYYKFTFDKFKYDHSPEVFALRHQRLYNDILNNKFNLKNYLQEDEN